MEALAHLQQLEKLVQPLLRRQTSIVLPVGLVGFLKARELADDAFHAFSLQR
jgi:hypothetical protein